MPTIPWTTPNQPAPGTATALVMASRFEVRTLRDVPRFFLRSLAAWKQLRQARGALGASLVAQPLRRTFWTLSAWEGREQLNAFAAAEPHRTIMRELHPTMRESVFTFWEVPVGELPISWDDARRRVAAQPAVDQAS
ncbi:DUF3291 domain-containing protein [Streptacidiphilus jiangxiensis]|uniref:DUF3291 domain-containing protein n=1 Tax=Streptacidiphilus jiangxiensis TaxID=235985 RepID=A0A1H7Z324_STRJI|nr:DUF3291 domain-containing protein [Streptacidiphilus jiangxiensis]SEM52653.1 protein of unknown function [Streptacidiphilus jiangxiensis]